MFTVKAIENKGDLCANHGLYSRASSSAVGRLKKKRGEDGENRGFPVFRIELWRCILGNL